MATEQHQTTSFRHAAITPNEYVEDTSDDLETRSDTYLDDTISPARNSIESTHSLPATPSKANEKSLDHEDADFSLYPQDRSCPPPNPHRWTDMSKWRKMLPQRPLSSLRSSNWFPDRATRPLLLTFDAFDTLFTPSEPIAKQYCDISREFGFEFGYEEVKQSFKRAFKDMNSRYPNYGKETNMHYSTWWTDLITATLNPLLPPPHSTIPEELTNRLYIHFSTSAAYTLYRDVLPFLRRLGTPHSSSTWPPCRTMLGILSNTDPRTLSILPTLGLPVTPSLFPPRYTPHSRRRLRMDFGPAHFAFATLSYDAGFAKPDRRIFDRAGRDAQKALEGLHPVARLSRTGGQLLGDIREEFHHMHVGDDLEKDVLPALECGWDGVLIDRSAKESVGTRAVGGKNVTVVNSLLALRHLLTKERLEVGGGQKPVWVDEEQGPVLKKRVSGKALKGRRIVDHVMSVDGAVLSMIE